MDLCCSSGRRSFSKPAMNKNTQNPPDHPASRTGRVHFTWSSLRGA